MPERRFVEAGSDHGGRMFTEWELMLPMRWRIKPEELTALSHAHTRLDLSLEDLEGAIADLEQSGRPEWARQLARRLKWMGELRDKIHAEFGIETSTEQARETIEEAAR